MTETLIAYNLRGAGMNEKGALEKLVSQEWHRFSNVYDSNFIDEKFKVPSKFRKYDFIETFDGYTIVSQIFLKFCETHNYKNLEFVIFPNDKDFFWLKVQNVLAFDAKKKGTLFINYSEKYQGFEEVIRATRVILKDEKIIHDGIFRTDIFFADGESKHPLIIIGLETKNKMQNAKLSGLVYEEIVKTS